MKPTLTEREAIHEADEEIAQDEAERNRLDALYERQMLAFSPVNDDDDGFFNFLKPDILGPDFDDDDDYEVPWF